MQPPWRAKKGLCYRAIKQMIKVWRGSNNKPDFSLPQKHKYHRSKTIIHYLDRTHKSYIGICGIPFKARRGIRKFCSFNLSCSYYFVFCFNSSLSFSSWILEEHLESDSCEKKWQPTVDKRWRLSTGAAWCWAMLGLSRQVLLLHALVPVYAYKQGHAGGGTEALYGSHLWWLHCVNCMCSVCACMPWIPV